MEPQVALLSHGWQNANANKNRRGRKCGFVSKTRHQHHHPLCAVKLHALPTLTHWPNARPRPTPAGSQTQTTSTNVANCWMVTTILGACQVAAHVCCCCCRCCCSCCCCWCYCCCCGACHFIYLHQKAKTATAAAVAANEMKCFLISFGLPFLPR